MSGGQRVAAAVMAMLASFGLGPLLYFSAVACVCACEPEISQAQPLPVESSVPKVTLKEAWIDKGGRHDRLLSVKTAPDWRFSMASILLQFVRR